MQKVNFIFSDSFNPNSTHAQIHTTIPESHDLSSHEDHDHFMVGHDLSSDEEERHLQGPGM